MQQPQSPPTVVIVGRPNVGKSTLFNSILGQRRSIVGDEPGITRDRIIGDANYRGRRFDLIDTGGIIPNDAEMIPAEILKQASVALSVASQIILLIDGRAEITGTDRDLARMLQKLGKPVTVAVNKMDTPHHDSLAHEFYALGFSDIFPVSAEHRLGIEDLMAHVTRDFTISEDKPEEEQEKGPKRIKVAIIGRPNVGKSTLLNALAGSERAIVSPIAGTTRDSVDESIQIGGTEFIFVDTAGIRRKGKTHLMAEKLSVVMARRNIRMANVVLLLIDATEGPVALDATIGGYAHEDGRAVIICVNKWDAAIPLPEGNTGKRAWTDYLRDQFKFLDFAPIIFMSAKERTGIRQLTQLIEEAFDSASRRVGTGELNRFATTVHLEPDVKVKYITQASVRPPTFIVFTDRNRPLHFSAERHLINRLRKEFGFKSTPIVVKSKNRRA